MNTTQALELVAAERDRQEFLFYSDAIPMVASQPNCPDELRLAALIEEVGEVGRTFFADGGDLKTELVQVAAVAVAWLEAL